MSRRNIASRLVEIGRYENCRLEEYDPGQFFVHKIFGYRGVVLFPWAAKLIDFDTPATRKRDRKSQSPSKSEDVVKPNYQVLVDQRDYPHVRVLKDDLTLFHKDRNSGKMYLSTLIGFSHVAHDDVLPYVSTESQCLRHDSFSVCFNSFFGKSWRVVELPALRSWRDHCLPYLEFSAVYRQTTQNVRVTAVPFYLGHYLNSDKNEKTYMWRYSIRLENFGQDNVTLKKRKWEIVDGFGRSDPHEGVGVVGVQPRLSMSKRAFQYSSFVELPSARGHMSGTYTMQRDDGTSFGCDIPRFSLEGKEEVEDDILS